MREQIAEFLAQGYKQAQVAQFCGCSEAYVSELLKEESFKERLRELFRKNVEERLNTKYDDLEEVVLKELKASIANAEISELTRILDTIARVKNAKRPVGTGNLTNPTVGVTLIFPQQQIPQLITDDKNRVISIGDKTMMPMPSKGVRNLFAKMDEEQVTITKEDLGYEQPKLATSAT